MNALRTLGLVSIAAGSFSLVACSGGGIASKSPEERVDAVKSAISKPSGQVDAVHAKLALEASLSQSQFQTAGAFLQGIPGLTSGSVDAKCVSGSSTDGKIDVGCSSGGKASGSVEVKVNVSAGASGSSELVEEKFDNVCENGTCLNGSLVVSVEASAQGSATIMQGSIDLDQNGKKSHGDWGTSVSTGAGGAKVDLVVFDDAGDSYVVSASVSAENATGKVTIKGANGEFSCQYDGGGETGSCSGAATFNW